MSALIDHSSAQPLQSDVRCDSVFETGSLTSGASRPIAIVAVVLMHLLAFALFRLAPIVVSHETSPVVVALINQEWQAEQPVELPSESSHSTVVRPDIPVPTAPTLALHVEAITEASPVTTTAFSSVATGGGFMPVIAESGTELALMCPERSAPSYPAQSKRLREQGEVTLHVLLDETGVVRDVDVLKSSGSPRLDAAGIATVRAWRCRPAMRDNQAVQSTATQTFEFVLNKR